MELSVPCIEAAMLSGNEACNIDNTEIISWVANERRGVERGELAFDELKYEPVLADSC
jgi:hypothetical protein